VERGQACSAYECRLAPVYPDGAASLAAPIFTAFQAHAATSIGTTARTFLSRLQPAVAGGGFELPDYWVWCGAPIRGEDGRYHLFRGKPAHVEDPFLWHEDGRVQALMKDMTGEICGEKFASVHVTSADGLANFTHASFTDRRDKDDQKGFPAEVFDVTVVIDELRTIGDFTMEMHRSNHGTNNRSAGTVTFTHGRATMHDVVPCDLITLRSSKSPGVQELNSP
jgi:hypothetical protein